METLRTEVIEEGAKRDRRGRRILPPERIEALVSEFRASGLTQAAFARREGRRSDLCRLGARASGPSWPVIRRGRAAVCSTAGADRADGLGGVERGTADGVVVRGHAVRALAALVRALRGELPALASLSCPIN